MAAALSTQYLFQPFVWQNWPWDEVLAGWVPVLWHCFVEGMLVATALLAAANLPLRSLWASACLIVASVGLGVASANAILVLLDVSGITNDVPSVVARVIRWAAIAACSIATYILWWRTGRLQAQAREADLKRVQSEHQITQARLQALRNQIEPHFLFNTLATVRRLHQTDPGEGARLLGHFIAYLRSTLPQLDCQQTTLGREIELVRAYLGVVAVRMSGRLLVQVDIPSGLQTCSFPPLCIATLVENAVKHGISSSPTGGEITVRAQRIGDRVEIQVCDTGVGFGGSTGGNGVGLANIRARLKTLYGNRGSLRLEGNTPSGVRATIVLPWQPNGQAA